MNFCIGIFFLLSSVVLNAMDLQEISKPEADSSNELLTRNPLFCEEEWDELQAGLYIIHDRLRKKQETLTYLRSGIPFVDKLLCCVLDFGAAPVAGSDVSSESAGIDRYCSYISFISDTYNKIRTLGQSLAKARSIEEKNQYQDLLYYFLSIQEKIFQAVVNPFTHQIPEHSQENTFYGMINQKMCANATKEYEFLLEYIIVLYEAPYTRIQIDNAKLLRKYRELNKDIFAAFNRDHPVFWMRLLDVKVIQKQAKKQVDIIEKCLEECNDAETAATNYLTSKIRTLDESSRVTKVCVSNTYQQFGPLVLETIRRYEGVTDRIKQIERDAITWLNDMKRQFKKIPDAEMREIISTYLEDQNKKEAERKREEAEKKREEAEKKSEDDRAAAKAIAALKKQKKEEKRQKKATHLPPQHLDRQASTRPLTTSEDAADTATDLKFSVGSSSSTGWPPQPKTKIKTRPSAALGAAAVIEDDEESIGNAQEFMLPERLRTNEFKDFIQSLMKAKNERRLKQLADRFNKDYGIFFQTEEKKNKGFFAMKSPITNEFHLFTYHHSHKENPFGSIFMAMRDLLRLAGLI